jgi:hypothetical protein
MPALIVMTEQVQHPQRRAQLLLRAWPFLQHVLLQRPQSIGERSDLHCHKQFNAGWLRGSTSVPPLSGSCWGASQESQRIPESSPRGRGQPDDQPRAQGARLQRVGFFGARLASGPWHFRGDGREL